MDRHSLHSSRSARILACVLCQHRKIRCDRSMPCANCEKAHVTCTPSTPAPARKRRRPNQDLQNRLARCEELLKQFSAPDLSPDNQATTSPESPPPRTSPNGEVEEYISWRPAGKVVSNDGNVRFMDSYLWASIQTELSAMRTSLEYDDLDDDSPQCSDANTPEESSEWLLGSHATGAPIEYSPDSGHVFRLWQFYLDRVNPLTKIIHVPSLQPFVAQAAAEPRNVPLKMHALLFAIYTMAVSCLSEAECQQLLGLSIDAAHAQFSSGFKSSMSRSNFLRTYDLTTVQALSIYLLSLQGSYNKDSLWVMHGLLIRISQKLGIHRDGDVLGLSPFDTEIQRRIWWQILSQDGKLALHCGLSHFHLPSNFDTKLPLNLDDADMVPNATEPILARNGPTEMAYCLLSYRMTQFMLSSFAMHGYESFALGRERNDALLNSNTDANNLDHYAGLQAQTRKLDEDLRLLTEKYVDHSAGPIHVFASLFRPLIMGKIHAITTPIRDQPEWGSEIFGPKDNLFKVSVSSNEGSLKAYNLLPDNRFLWYIKMHFQADIFTLLIAQLGKRVRGTLVDRAWKVIDGIYGYHTELWDMSQRKNGARAYLVVKAWKAREQSLRQLGLPIDPPECLPRLQSCLSTDMDMRPLDVPSSTSDAGMTSTSTVPDGDVPERTLDIPELGGVLNFDLSTPPIMQATADLATGREDVNSSMEQYLTDTWGVQALDWDIWETNPQGTDVQNLSLFPTLGNPATFEW